jgi:5'-nucleotidase
VWTDRNHVRWDTARGLAPGVIRRLLEIGWSADTCLNVNFPDRPADEVGPLTVARQGAGLLQGMLVETRTDPRGIAYHWLNFRRGARPQGPDADTDVIAAGRIAVTPIRYDRTDAAAFDAMGAVLPRL